MLNHVDNLQEDKIQMYSLLFYNRGLLRDFDVIKENIYYSRDIKSVKKMFVICKINNLIWLSDGNHAAKTINNKIYDEKINLNFVHVDYHYE